MAAEVWYRKWRPQTFADVVGQRHITDTIARAVALGRVAHAYLFCGPRGTGKTTTARLLAKAVNCENNGDGQPCGHCPSCVAVAEGRALDLIEMDAASNRGIDEIRALREKVGYSPSEGRYKVYIIDEVHELTTFAFDALLKTLEEPPPHVIFVLATTEAHRVPETILSRCQRFDFVRIKLSDVVGRLRQICLAEGVEADEAALTLIARRTGGALRDAVNVLEQTVASQGPRLTEEGVRAAMGGRGDARAADLVGHLTARDLAGALNLVAAVRDDGIEPRRFAADVVETLRAVLLVRAGAGASLDLSESEMERLRTLSGEAEVADLLRAAKLISAADFRADPQSPLPLELAIVEVVAGQTQPVPAASVSVEPTPRAAGGETAIKRPSVPPTVASATTTRPAPRPSAAETPPARRAPDPPPGRRSAMIDRLARAQSLGRDGVREPMPAPPAALQRGPAESPPREEPSSGRQIDDAERAPETPSTGDSVTPIASAAATSLRAVAEPAEADVAAPDDRPAAVSVDALPFEEDGDITEASVEGGDLLDTARRRFRDIYDRCRERNRTAAALLNSRCDIVEVANGKVTFGIESEMLAARAGETAYSRAIAEAVSTVLGAEYTVAFVVRPDVISRMEALSAERPSHLLDEALKRGARLLR